MNSLNKKFKKRILQSEKCTHFFSFFYLFLSIKYLTQIKTEKIEFGTQLEIEKTEIKLKVPTN